MAIRGAKKQRNVDRGFVISDHADWPGLLRAIDASEASRVLVTHGQVPVMVRYLRERGFEADALETEFEGEGGAERGEVSVVDETPSQPLTNGNPRGTPRRGEGADREDVKGSEKSLALLPNNDNAPHNLVCAIPSPPRGEGRDGEPPSASAQHTPSPPRGEGRDGVVDYNEPHPKLPP